MTDNAGMLRRTSASQQTDRRRAATMASLRVTDVDDALALLTELGAPPHLVRHHALVAEAATDLVAGLAEYRRVFDGAVVVLGAAVHDAGKILHPAEMRGPGHRHEAAGRDLLLVQGLPHLARYCVSHAQWSPPGVPLEDLLVALADKLWKGKRVQALEHAVVTRLAAATGAEFWEVFVHADSAFERVAADGATRLARSLG